jgi:hypothetical protein
VCRKASIDIIELDLPAVVRRIASDLTQLTRSRRAEPVTFQVSWVPSATHHSITGHAAHSLSNAPAQRRPKSLIAA